MGRRLSISFCLLLAMAALGVPGGWYLKEVWPSFRDYHASGDWLKARAQVLDVVVKPIDGRFGPDTLLEASYKYTIAGSDYVGNRLQWRDPLDSNGSDDWKQDMQEFLGKARAEGRTITIQVNPARPEEAVIDSDIGNRGMVWVAGMALLACVIVLAFAWLLFELWRTPLAVAQRRPPPPPEPQAGLLLMWVMATLWNGFMLPIVIFAVPDLVNDGEWIGLAFLGLFVFIGLMILLGVVMGTWHRLLSMVRNAA